MAEEVRYRIHVPLQNYEGAKTGEVYTCTPGATYRAPEGEFKHLSRGDYSRLDTRSTEGSADSSDSNLDDN